MPYKVTFTAEGEKALEVLAWLNGRGIQTVVEHIEAPKTAPKPVLNKHAVQSARPIALRYDVGDLPTSVNEVPCKILAHNIVVLIHEMHELGIEPEFWPGQQPMKAGE